MCRVVPFRLLRHWLSELTHTYNIIGCGHRNSDGRSAIEVLDTCVFALPQIVRYWIAKNMVRVGYEVGGDFSTGIFRLA